MGIQVVEARSEADRQAVYALRYDVYVDEMRRHQVHADHEGRMLAEPDDENAVLLLARSSAGHAIGTARVHLTVNIPRAYAEMYQMERFEHFHPSETSSTTKLMVAAPFRNTPLALRLAQACYDIGSAAGVSFTFIDCNAHLKKFFGHLGFRQVMPTFEHVDYGMVTPMVLALRDYDYLRRIGSPFRLPDSVEAHPSVAFFDRLLSRPHQFAERVS